MNKIFISKAELKHTTSKVFITLHVYNQERRILIRKLNRMEALLFPSKENKNKLLSLEERLHIIKNQEDNIPLIT
jgi:hypothetical protein